MNLDDVRLMDRIRRMISASKLTIAGLYVPISRQVVVDGTGLTVGTYDYTVTDYSIPSGALAVNVYVVGRWTTASSSSYLTVNKYNTSDNYGLLFAIASGIFASVNVIVPIASNKIRIVVAGADMNSCYIILTGYITG